MALYVPKRSVTGCLTCKQRKKKCDETRPVCRRCSRGEFPCLGYGQPDSADRVHLGQDRVIVNTTSSCLASQDTTGDLLPTTSRDVTPSLELGVKARQNNTTLQKTTHPTITVPGCLQISPEDTFIQGMMPLIMRHYKDLVGHVLFKPLAIPVEQALQWRANSSKFIRWAMYIGARIVEAMSNGDDGQSYMAWVTRFYQHVMASSASADLDIEELEAKFSVLRDLTMWVFAVLGTSNGYLLFRTNASLFLRLAAIIPQVWSDDGTVSISKVAQIKQYEMKNFILHDTLLALALGIPSVVLYDVSESWAEETPDSVLEWVHGLPAGIVLLLAKINSWRTSRLREHTDSSRNGWELIEAQLHNWSSDLDLTDQAPNYIARVAVQECWRHAGLIYLYMGMCGVSSSDPRVQSGVRQVVQLASTVTEDSPLRVHLFMPCLIAGVAASREKHRAIARNKMEMTRNVVSLTLRGADFIPVLDHLWHGPAAGGGPVTWQDYVESRCSVLPIVF